MKEGPPMGSSRRVSGKILPVVFLLTALSTPLRTNARTSDLTFDDRVAAQEAIERVYYAHQIGTTKPFEEAVPRAVLEEKVRTFLKKSVALDQVWHIRITGEMLRSEVERMARETRMPERLRELFDALKDDPLVVEECLARPILVNRLVREQFAFDTSLHESARREAEDLQAQLKSGRLAVTEVSLDAWWSDEKGRFDENEARSEEHTSELQS